MSTGKHSDPNDAERADSNDPTVASVESEGTPSNSARDLPAMALRCLLLAIIGTSVAVIWRCGVSAEQPAAQRAGEAAVVCHVRRDPSGQTHISIGDTGQAAALEAIDQLPLPDAAGSGLLLVGPGVRTGELAAIQARLKTRLAGIDSWEIAPE